MISHPAHTNLSWIAGLALQLYNRIKSQAPSYIGYNLYVPGRQNLKL